MVFSILSEYDKELMLYVTGVGFREPQEAINRKEGFIDYQLFLVTKGSGIVEYKGREFSVSEGEAFFMPKLIPHKYYPLDDEFSTLWISFDGKHIDDILTRFSLTEPCKFKPSSFSVLTQLHKQMYQYAKNIHNCDNAVLSSFLYRFIVECYSSRQNESTQNHSYVYKIKDYLLNNFKEEITLDKLCRDFHLSKSTLCRDFKKAFNVTVIDYLIDIRIRFAKSKLAENPDIPVKEICYDVGFKDIGYFTKTFKAREGITPTQYRKKT